MADEFGTLTVARPTPVDDGAIGQGLPAVGPAACPPCDAPMTAYGLRAESPFASVDAAACGYGVDCTLPLVTDGDLATHPKASCAVQDADPAFVAAVVSAVADKIADRYGLDALAPCYGPRVFDIHCDTVMIDGLLRLDRVEVADSCGCHRCDAEWRALDVCDLMVGPHHDPPWTELRSCTPGAWCGGRLRVWGIWGDIWPIPAGVKLATILLVAKTIENARAKGAVVSNRETGETQIDVPEFDFAELAMLPHSVFRYRGGGV